MTQDLPSIEDLMKKSKPAPSTGVAKSFTKAPIASAKLSAAGIQTTEEKLTEKISAIGQMGKEEETKKVAAAAGVQYVDLKGFPISADALRLVPEEQAAELLAIPFLFTGPELRVGAVHPENEKVKELVFQLEERNKTHAVVYKISQDGFEHAVKLYATLPKIKAIVKGVEIKPEDLEKYQTQMANMADVAKLMNAASTTDILIIIVAAALKLKSSDIHVEAEEHGIIVRLRVDGILQEISKIDVEKWKQIINRIKLISGLKINVTDKPQDGRFTIFEKGKNLDVRVSALPTTWGESVVMRILNPEAAELGFESLGFRPAALTRLIHEIEKPHGMIVTTGPTGSGKTTTLYAVLKHLNEPGVKIITLEDPIEYKLEGINQSQIDPSRDYTFAKGLRSILRQDPDIVMVGEIRDLETAETAIQAALTGHLMLSTIHTNDAAGAVPRFLSMGVKAFLLAPALNCVMGQRLIRRLCSDCKKPAEIDPTDLELIKKQLDSIPEASGEAKVDTSKLQFLGPVGCDKCNSTGYKGRVGVYEILVKNPEIEKFILSGEISEYAMRDVAQKQGMVTMAQDGLLKALDGQTSVEEVKRNVGL
jgi:type II secretory ATPase GspE/PulE/Tfp pilus assembly ATPase PilB-like protein